MYDVMRTAVTGLQKAMTQLGNAASSIVKTSSTTNDSQNSASATNESQSDGDLATSVVEMKEAEIAFKANAAVIRAESKTEKNLLDTLA